MKILSVIIPTYNMEKYLRRCLDSLIIDEEGMKQLEVLIINDGSKDLSSKIAHEYQDKYPDTYRVIDKENGNYGSCINRGLQEAKGKYIKILDADDYFANESFSRYMKKISNIDVDIVLNDANLVNPFGNILKTWKFNLSNSIIDDFFSWNIFPEMHTVAYRTSNLRKINYVQLEGISYTDQQWIFLPMTTVHKGFYFNEPLYQYLVGREGQTMQPDIVNKNRFMMIKVLTNMFDVYNTIDTTYVKKNWMHDKLISNITGFFRLHIIDLKQAEDIELLDFEKHIKESNDDFHNELIKKMVLSPKMKYNYGIKWSKDHCINYDNPILILYYFMKKILGHKNLFIN